MYMNFKTILLAFLIGYSFQFARAQNHGSLEDRQALFDYIIEKTKDRESFSPAKEKALNFNPIKNMLALRQEVLSASNDTELYYALQKLSAARKDRHLSIDVIEGGLELTEMKEGQAPIRFHPDFKSESYAFFVSDLGKNANKSTKGKPPELGDMLVGVNGQSLQDYIEKAKVYTRYSTINNMLMRMAYSLSEKSYDLPPSFYEEKLTLQLKSADGKTYTSVMDYENEVEWIRGRADKNYAGYKKEESFNFDSFELYIPTDPEEKNLVLWWYGFRGDLPDASDALIAYADKNDMLDYDLIIDAVDSRGGSQGAYAIARLTSKPFKTTGGNLKLSDITDDFIAGYTRRYLSKKAIMDGEGRENEDDGTWAIEWLHGPVLKALAAGQEYSNNTPFKCAHLPHYSDWVMQPAEKHFTGKMVVFFGPWGGSHLTQFASMIIDNDLGYTLGMPDGGYSNTWEWEEDVVFPTTKKPVVEFMWSIGHTLRPNGEIAEGNPPMVDAYIPVTKDNYFGYKQILLDNAQEYLDKTP